MTTRPSKKYAPLTVSGKRAAFVWTAKTDALLGTAPDPVIGAQLQILSEVVWKRRSKLGISAFAPASLKWTKKMDALLGTASDPVVAAQLQIHAENVRKRRLKLGIAAFGMPYLTWTAKMDALLGTAPDPVVEMQLQISPKSAGKRRRLLGIAPFGNVRVKWTKKMERYLGNDLDTVIAQKLGITAGQVSRRRHQLGIAGAQNRPESLKKIIARSGTLRLPSEPPLAATARRFLIDQPQVRFAGEPFPDTEDFELTAYLKRALAEVYSKSEQPPACPYCHSRWTALGHRPHASTPIPRFKCKACKQTFNRVIGTPLFRLRSAKLPLFIRLLSQQIPYEEAARHLGVSDLTIARWTKQFRRWLLQLDPTGKWERKVRLGIKVRPHIRCPRCCVDGEKYFIGYVPAGERRLFCPACSTTFSIGDAERLTQQKVRLEVFYDPGKVDFGFEDGDGKA